MCTTHLLNAYLLIMIICSFILHSYNVSKLKRHQFRNTNVITSQNVVHGEAVSLPSVIGQDCEEAFCMTENTVYGKVLL